MTDQLDPGGCKERVYLAVKVLVGHGDLRARLLEASEHLNALQIDEFRESLQNQFLSVRAALSGYLNSSAQGTHPVMKLDDEQAVQVSEEIVDLFFALTEPD
ncbi:MAG: hypothetical protein KF699_07775 [Phycisphaeraceae bacterium]|nr:hypothetical protein [Phycisphaeraceae bacterium]